MLVDFILFKFLSNGVKISDELPVKLGCPPDFLSPLDVANILQTIASELKNLSERNLKMHDKLNRFGVTGSATASATIKPI